MNLTISSEVYILDDGIAVSRRSDLIFYLVPVEDVERVVAQYGPSTRKDAIVSSGTSVMTPNIEAFEKYLPDDVNIINWHWLFGPSIEPQEHDKITADTQAVTHVGFEAMGTAWKNMGGFPWENPTYVGGVDNVKVLMCLRIYGGKPHVYSGLAIHNPFAREQITQYAKSESDLFGLMIQEDEQQFREKINRARESIVSCDNSHILLDDRIMGEFSIGIPSEQRTPNSHLSLLSMANAWYQAGVSPYDNMICQTPLFRLRLGIVEYLFRCSELLEETIQTALYNKRMRRDDLEFHTAVREWSTIIGNRNVSGYHRQFEATKEFFADRIPEGMRKSNELIQRL